MTPGIKLGIETIFPTRLGAEQTPLGAEFSLGSIIQGAEWLHHIFYQAIQGAGEELEEEGN